jgi:hypothetical protein
MVETPKNTPANHIDTIYLEGTETRANIMVGGITFSYEHLFYEHPVGVPKIRVYGPNKGELVYEDRTVDMDIAMSQHYYALAQQATQANDALVHVYDDEDKNVYRGSFPLNELLDTSKKFTAVAPSMLACSFNVEKNDWVPIVFIIRDNGTWAVHPNEVCPICLIHLTEEEYESFPKPPTHHHLWSFSEEIWKDGRSDVDLANSALGNYATVAYAEVEPPTSNNAIVNVSPIRNYVFLEELISEIKSYNMMPEAVREKMLGECVGGQHYTLPHASELSKALNMSLKEFFASKMVADIPHTNSATSFAKYNKKHSAVVKNISNRAVLVKLEAESAEEVSKIHKVTIAE